MSTGYLTGKQYWINVFVTFDSVDRFYVNVRITGVSSCTSQWCVTLYYICDFFNLQNFKSSMNSVYQTLTDFVGTQYVGEPRDP
jgi:hypothetical protein